MPTTKGWNFTLLTSKKYTINNYGFSHFASCETRPDSGASVCGGRRNQQWIIKETRVRGNFTISPTDANLFWGLTDSEVGTPIALAEDSTAPENQWIFARDDPESGPESEPEDSTNRPFSALPPSFGPPVPAPALGLYVNKPICNACRIEIPALDSRVRCLICDNYDLCAVCALGERFAVEHTIAHSTAIFRISGNRNQLPVISQTWICYRTNAPLNFDTRLQSPAFTLRAIGFTCDVCEEGIPALAPRVHCLICNDYDLCAVCALGEDFAGGHTSAHSTVIFRICGNTNQVPVVSPTWILYESAFHTGRGNYSCNACETFIPTGHPRVRCLICRNYNLCAVCALGERFAGEHTSAHSMAIFHTSGDQNELVVSSDS
ncbi:hypothetical protein B0H16DRAFT_906633 [Mycena metata]|uniref:ZZ-type domain-containing protein n=1 Tax=Mycena metata TaxID=1033252 RepID=A0AAD7IQY6_9AGAR|nr:hypothetical protein B0H16DRAFT_906633 [Mycena metata]